MAKNSEDIRKSKQRGFVVQRSYEFDIHDADGNVVWDISPEAWAEKVKAQWDEVFKDCEHGAYIVHDKDIIPKTGDPKPVHIHGVVCFKNPRFVGSTMDKLGLSRVENCQRPKAYAGAYRYLTHITEEAIQSRKHIYAVDEVKVFGDKRYIELIQRASSGKDEEKAQALEYVDSCHKKIQEGEMLAVEVLGELKKNFSNSVAQSMWRQHQKYLEKDEETYVRTEGKKDKENRGLATYMIMGASGSGKTTIARALAKRLSDCRGYHIASAEGKTTFDMVSNYRGEKVSVLDEVEGSSFNIRQFLAVFDPNFSTTVASRNKDKEWNVKHAFFTYAEGFETWMYGILAYSKGGSNRLDKGRFWNGKFALKHNSETESEYLQVVRRFKYLVEIGEGAASYNRTIKVYQLDEFRHYLIGCVYFNSSNLIDGLEEIVDEVEAILESPRMDKDTKYSNEYLDKLEEGRGEIVQEKEEDKTEDRLNFLLEALKEKKVRVVEEEDDLPF